jgi:hypothetical protein
MKKAGPARTLHGSDGRRYTPGELLKSGGAGSVHRVHEDAGLVAKLYHGHVERGTYERKVLAMLSLSPDLPDFVEGGQRFVQIAWPKALLRDEQGRFVGFVMPAVDIAATSELECVLQEKQARRLGLPTGLGARLTLAANLAAVIAELHRRQHRVVDLKPVNLRFYPRSLYLAMLDCDGFSIQGQGERFPGPQFTVDYLAPEFHGGELGPAGEEAQDRFALAVVVFQLLNFGIHPYRGRPLDERVPTDIPSRIAGRFYAYGQAPHPRLQPNPSSGHAAMPAELRTLFDRAFAGPPAARPSGLEWAALLRNYAQRSQQRLANCSRDDAHQHFTGLACAACARDGLIADTRKRNRSAGRAQPTPVHPTAGGATKPTTTGGRRVYGFANPNAAASMPTPTIYNYPFPPRVPVPAPAQSKVSNVLAFLAGIVFFTFTVVRGCANIEPPAPPPPPVTHRPFPVYPPAQATDALDPQVEAIPSLQSPPGSDIGQLPASAGADEWRHTQQYVRQVGEALADRDLDSGDDALKSLARQSLAHAQVPANRGDADARIRFLEFMPKALHAGSTGKSASDVRAQWRRDLLAQIQAQPYDAELANEWAWLALLDGNPLEAQQGFLRAIWAQPQQPQGWYGLGVALDSDRVRYGLLTRFEDLRAAGDPETEALLDFTREAMRISHRDHRRFRILHARALRNSLERRGQPVPAFVGTIASQPLDKPRP